jgi:hypothetical protein
MEDHAADDWRYACMSRVWLPQIEAVKPANRSGYSAYEADRSDNEWITY